MDSTEATYGSIDLATGFAMDANLIVKSESEAKQIGEALRGIIALTKMTATGFATDDAQSKLIGDMVRDTNATVTEVGRDVKVAISFSGETAKNLETLFDGVVEGLMEDEKKPVSRTGSKKVSKKAASKTK